MYKAINNIREQKGFTLIELLIVVAIIGILAAIAVPAYIGAQEKARKSNLQKATKSAESDLNHWLNSAMKGVVANVPVGTNPKADLTEVDTNWDGAITAGADLTNNGLFTIGAPSAAQAVVTQYITARTTNVAALNGIEMSPWQGMNGCAVGMPLFNDPGADPGPNVVSTACTVDLAALLPIGNNTANSIRIIGSTNGPGGNDTANTELLTSAVVSAD